MYRYVRQASQNSTNLRCSEVTTKPASLVSVALDSCCWGCCGGLTDPCSLKTLPFLELKKCIDSLLSAIQNVPKFSPAAVADANDVAERNRFAGNLCGDGSGIAVSVKASIMS